MLNQDEIYEKSSDDGEPSGTAGAPMLNLLQKNDLCNVIIIVTRYFGGILLGTGGLVRAYSGATTGAIDNCKKARIQKGTGYQIEVDYSNYQALQYYCNKNKINIKNSEYNENIICTLEMSDSIKDRFLEDLNNKKLNILEIKNQKDIMIIE